MVAALVGLDAVVMVVVGVVLAQPVLWVVGLVLVPAALVAVPFTSVAVTVDGGGLRVAFGPVGWPVMVVPLDQIDAVELIADLVPMRWGGWGYRGSRAAFRRAAVVLRRGPAIGVQRRDGSYLAVTVEDAAAGVAALAAQLGRSPAPDRG